MNVIAQVRRPPVAQAADTEGIIGLGVRLGHLLSCLKKRKEGPGLGPS